jgi:hypothetical protein
VSRRSRWVAAAAKRSSAASMAATAAVDDETFVETLSAMVRRHLFR